MGISYKLTWRLWRWFHPNATDEQKMRWASRHLLPQLKILQKRVAGLPADKEVIEISSKIDDLIGNFLI